MALRNIVLKEDLTLRKKCRDVTVFDKKLHQLLDDMTETMVDSDGVGLAAPQVGILRRIVVIDVGQGVVEMINPVITQKNDTQTGIEGCLSCPGEIGIVTRPNQVSVQFFDRNGKEQEVQGEGLYARAICHELDHLSGVLFTDIADKLMTQEELEEYLEKENNDEE